MKLSKRQLVLLLALAVSAGGYGRMAYADEHERREDWREHERREHEWRDHEWREHYYAPPPVVYSPPPATVYAPPPVVVGQPGINIVVPLRIR